MPVWKRSEVLGFLLPIAEALGVSPDELFSSFDEGMADKLEHAVAAASSGQVSFDTIERALRRLPSFDEIAAKTSPTMVELRSDVLVLRATSLETVEGRVVLVTGIASFVWETPNMRRAGGFTIHEDGTGARFMAMDTWSRLAVQGESSAEGFLIRSCKVRDLHSEGKRVRVTRRN